MGVVEEPLGGWPGRGGLDELESGSRVSPRKKAASMSSISAIDFDGSFEMSSLRLESSRPRLESKTT